MSRQSIFIAGTDTNVGKTVVACALSIKLGLTYWKPVQSGAIEGTDRSLAQTMGIPTLPEEYCLLQPLSPHLAARYDHQSIELEKIVNQYRMYQMQHDLLMEGAGGLLVPLNEDQLLIDLIKAFGCSVILVARASLGTINHTLLSLEALASREIKAQGVIIVGKSDLEVEKTICKFGNTKILGRMPVLPEVSRSMLMEKFVLNNFESYEVKDGIYEKYV